MKRIWLVLAIAAGLVLALPVTAQVDNTRIALAEFDKVIQRAGGPGMGWLFIAPAAAKAQIDAVRPLILDVRRADEFAAGRIEGAVLIPITELTLRLGELPADRLTRIIVYCKAGVRGSYGLMVLQLAGYVNARHITGGIDAWIAAGLPVVR